MTALSVRAALVGLLMLYAAASLMHFAHNAEYLGDYPSLPSSFTRSGVYLAWVGLASIGAVGLALYWYHWRLAGLLLLGLYAALGFGAHTGMMNFTIWFEVVTAAVLLFVVVLAAVRLTHRHALDA